MFKFIKNLFSKEKTVPAVEEVKEAPIVPMTIRTARSIVERKLDIVVDPLLGIRKDVAQMVKYVYKSTKFPAENLAKYMLKTHMPNLEDKKLEPVYDELKEVQNFLRILADVGSKNERIQRQVRDRVGDKLKAALAKLNEMVK